jgi:1,4-dihydroxy-6-naphthoate synthase
MRLAYSIDLDDAFMFWALATKKIDSRDFGFPELVHERADTATLNRWAREGSRDVVAVSIASWPLIEKNYLMLPHGGSVGRGYGPVIVAREDITPKTIGVPGERTTCDILVSLYAPDAERIFVPMEQSFVALRNHEVDACALIHEGRLTYRQEGFRLLQDLGSWWQEKYRLPLPLGGNVIRRSLGEDAIARASKMIYESIRYALDHRDQALDEIPTHLTRAQADEYLNLYANRDTLDYGEDGRRGMEALLGTRVEFSH